jgi:site-specific recombinase XerD
MVLASTGALQTAVLDAIADRLRDLVQELEHGSDRRIFTALTELEGHLEALRGNTKQVFLAADGRRLDRHGAGRIARRIARRAGITKTIGPHTLRHAFITAALDAGVPLRDVQEAASHADPRTTMRYDRARTSLDRHATYIVAAYVAGAAR